MDCAVEDTVMDVSQAVADGVAFLTAHIKRISGTGIQIAGLKTGNKYASVELVDAW